jgi:hypothetical protein
MVQIQIASAQDFSLDQNAMYGKMRRASQPRIPRVEKFFNQ